MGGIDRIPRDEALRVALQFKNHLIVEDCVEKIEIAGSLRREKPDVGDIEMVCIPRRNRVVSKDLFGDEHLEGYKDLLHNEMHSMLECGTLNLDRKSKDGKSAPFGPKYYRLNYRYTGNGYEKWYPVDLFTADTHNWGLIYLLRTGSGEFNQWFVQQGYRYGVKVAGGFVRENGLPRYTPTEESVFELMRVPWREPRDRENP